MAIKKSVFRRTIKDPRDPEFYAESIRLKNHKADLEKQHNSYRKGDFMEEREFRHYDFLFGEVANDGKSLLSWLKELYIKQKGKNKDYVMGILEDGSGKGKFMFELAMKLAMLGIKFRSTAMSLDKNPDLDKMKQGHLIDEVLYGPAEYQVLKPKSQDVIVSLAGSLFHTGQILKKDLLLKFAYALKENGQMFVGFGINPISHDLGMRGGLSPTQNKELNKDTLDKQMQNIKTALLKRGFKTEFYDANVYISELIKKGVEIGHKYIDLMQDVPAIVLKIERMSDKEYAEYNSLRSKTALQRRK